jgi:hypothetical protein
MMVYNPIRLRATAQPPRYPALATIAIPRFATIASSREFGQR